MKTKSFLKWAGSKFRLVDVIKSVLPPGKRLIEPFAGSGAVFLNTTFSQYILNDNNTDLINLYLYLQKEGEKFINYCERFFVTENNSLDKFLELREQFNLTKDFRLKAALFLYLNRHGYNGLCRYNSKGIFNVPFGRYTKPSIPLDSMRIFYEKTQCTTFFSADYLPIMQNARLGDVIYCDPPYVPLSATANFTKYSSSIFGETDQLLLAAQAKDLAERGITVIISNHDTAFTREIYEDAKIISFEVQRNISSKVLERKKVQELIAVFGG